MNSQPNATKKILTRQQVRLVDQLAVSELKMPSIVLMENAGRGAADIIASRAAQAKRVVVFCGCGNNGGDGFVIARHLHNRGRSVRCFLVGDAERLTPDTRTNRDIVVAMGVPVIPAASAEAIAEATQSIQPDEVVVDALLGTGFSGRVREPLAEAIRGINNATKSATAGIDVPSGLDCDTGEIGNVAVRADFTITFVAAKRGFAAPSATETVGQVYTVDIGTPPELTDRIAATSPTDGTP